MGNAEILLKMKNPDSIEVIASEDIPATDSNTRTPFLAILILLQEAFLVFHVGASFLWLENHRGGFFKDKSGAANRHAAAMTISLVLLMPNIPVVRIMLKKTTKKAYVEAAVLTLGIAFFGFGIIEASNIDASVTADLEIHGLFSIFALVGSSFLVLHAILRLLAFFKVTENIKWLHSLGLNHHVSEALFEIALILNFVSAETGYYSYIQTLLHYNSNLPLTYENEKMLYTMTIVSLSIVTFVSGYILVQRHNIRFHTGIITYQMYHEKGQEIAEAMLNTRAV